MGRRYSVPRWVKRDGELYVGIHRLGSKYVLVSDARGVLVVGDTLREVLEEYYRGIEARVVKTWFDREGNLHVEYTAPVYSGEYVADYGVFYDTWYRQ